MKINRKISHVVYLQVLYSNDKILLNIIVTALLTRSKARLNDENRLTEKFQLDIKKVFPMLSETKLLDNIYNT